MARTGIDDRSEKVIIELKGAKAERGLPLANFEAFVEHFRKALTDYDRQTRGEPTRRSGHLNVREEIVSAFRLTAVRPGSTILELEPIPRDEVEPDDGQEEIPGAELLSLITLRSMLAAVDSEEQMDPAVTESLSDARRTLGNNGRMTFKLRNGRAHARPVVIDEKRIRRLEGRAKKREPRPLMVSGRLHRIELEPDKVGIRSPAGVDWTCRYPADLEQSVKGLLDSIVSVRGVGSQSTAQRGTLTIEEIHAVPQFEQTPFFTFETEPLEALMARQGIEPRRGPISILPDDVSDSELDDFLKAMNDL